jgi:hypothetical protein
MIFGAERCEVEGEGAREMKRGKERYGYVQCVKGLITLIKLIN